MSQDKDWNYKTLDFDKDVAIADKLDNGVLNATDPNLKDFFGDGGKLLMYHGWNDQLISPVNSVNYYNSVADKMGGGDGPSRIDPLIAMEQWVEHGKAPDQLLAAHVAGGENVNRTRSLCPYPQTAEYKGSGSSDDAASFVCASGK